MPPQHCRRRHRRICPCATPRCHCLTCVGYGGRGGRGGGGRSHYSCRSIRAVHPPPARLPLHAIHLVIRHPLPLSRARTRIALRFTFTLTVRKDTLPLPASRSPSHFIITRNLSTMGVAVATARRRCRRAHAVRTPLHRHRRQRRFAITPRAVRRTCCATHAQPATCDTISTRENLSTRVHIYSTGQVGSSSSDAWIG